MRTLLRLNRVVLIAFVLLLTGLIAIAHNVQGNVALGAGLPVSSTALKINITSTGGAALYGEFAIIIGSIFLIFAFLLAILAEFTRPRF
jgi:hypothetical protein